MNTASSTPNRTHHAGRPRPVPHTHLTHTQAKAQSAAVVTPTKELIIPKYCESVFQTKRRPTRTVMVRGPLFWELFWERWRTVRLCSVHRASVCCWEVGHTLLQPLLASERHTALLCGAQIGKVPVGSQHRIALQTMTTTDTRNVQATVDQARRGHAFRGLGRGATPSPTRICQIPAWIRVATMHARVVAPRRP